MMVIQEMMDRQQLHGGHAQPLEIGEDVGMGEAGVGATPRLGQMGMAGGQPFDVNLVEERVVPRGPRGLVMLPGKRRVDHETLREVRSAVAPITTEIRFGVGPERIAKEGLVPPYPAGNGLGVGIKEELGRVEAMAVLWGIGTVYTIAIALPRTETGHIPVPDIIRAGWQRDAQILVGTLRGVEEAEINPRSMLGEQRKIHPSAIPGCPKRRGSTRIDVHTAALLRRRSVMLRHHVRPRAGKNIPLVLHHDLGWTPPFDKEVIALL